MAIDVRDIYGSQKIENLLNLALEATGEERAKSPELEVGFDPETKTWELIIKYSGDLGKARELAEEVYELQNEYAVLLVREDRIRAAITPRTRAMIFNNPNNPTGMAYGEDTLALLASIAQEYDLVVAADDIYTFYFF